MKTITRKMLFFSVMLLAFSFSGLAQHTLLYDNFEDTAASKASWSFAEEFQLDTAAGQADDPGTAHDGQFMIGTDITGNNGLYENNIGGGGFGGGGANPDYAISPAFSVKDSGFQKVELKFYRWMNIQDSTKDDASISVSIDDGANWTVVWINPGTDLRETEWSYQTIDITDAVGDTATHVRIRFGIDKTDGTTNYGGWNIDEVLVVGYTCLEPTNLDARYITETGARLEWELPTGEDSTNVVYGPAGFEAEDGTGTMIGVKDDDRYIVNDLEPDTKYWFYAQMVCGPDDKSVWTGPYAFTTLPCSQVRALDQIETFEVTPWKLKNANNNSTDWQEETSIYHEGAKSVYVKENKSDKDTLYVKCPLDLTNVEKPRLLFWQIANTNNTDGQCKVLISTDDGTNYTVLPNSTYRGAGDYSNEYFSSASYSDWGTTPTTNAMWKSEEFDLSDYKTDTVRLMFVLDQQGSAMQNPVDGWYLDSVAVAKTPTVVWYDSLFKEAATNDGAIENTISVSLIDEDFYAASGTMTEGTHFVTKNVPEGLSVSINIINVDSAVISLTGKANNHTNWADISNMEIGFKDAAFVGNDSANVTDVVNNAISVDFRVNVVFTEIMYNPPETGTDSLEYIELYNADSGSVNLNNWSFKDNRPVAYTFGNVDLAQGDFIVVAVNKSVVDNFFGITSYEATDGSFSNGGEDAKLVDNNGEMIDSVRFDDGNGWVTSPDGDGPSLVLCDVNSDNSLAANWKASLSFAGKNADGDEVYGSPMAYDTACSYVDLVFDAPPADGDTLKGCNYGEDSVKVTFKNQDYDDAMEVIPAGSEIYFWYQVDGGSIVADTMTVSTDIAQGETATFAFNQTYDFSDKQVYTIKVWMAYDEEPYAKEADDTMTYYINSNEMLMNIVPDVDTVTLSSSQNDTLLSASDDYETYEWKDADGNTVSTSKTYRAGVGKYYLTVTANGCTAEDSIVVDKVTGISTTLAHALRIYPNPNNGQFVVETPSSSNVTISIVNIQGQVVYNTTVVSTKTVVNLNSFNKGIYFVKLVSNNETVIRKIIVE